MKWDLSTILRLKRMREAKEKNFSTDLSPLSTPGPTLNETSGLSITIPGGREMWYSLVQFWAAGGRDGTTAADGWLTLTWKENSAKDE
jgi:hypothetical protein